MWNGDGKKSWELSDKVMRKSSRKIEKAFKEFIQLFTLVIFDCRLKKFLIIQDNYEWLLLNRRKVSFQGFLVVNHHYRWWNFRGSRLLRCHLIYWFSSCSSTLWILAWIHKIFIHFFGQNSKFIFDIELNWQSVHFYM